MTQNTQTTQERLLAIIGMNYRIIQHGDTRIADHSKAAEIIAAEIGAKDKRIAELEGLLRESAATLKDDIAKNNALKAAGDSLVAELAELDAKIAAMTLKAEAWDKREALVAASKLRDAALWEPGAPNLDRYRVTKSAWLVAEEEAETAAARAREARS